MSTEADWSELGAPGRPGDAGEPNAFAAAGLDRAGPHRSDAAWVAERLADPASRAVVVTARAVLLEPGDPPRPALVPLPALGGRASATRTPVPPVPPGTPVLLGLDGGARAVFAIDGEQVPVGADGNPASGAPGALDLLSGTELVGLRDAAGTLGQADGGLVGYASAILNWHRRHTHCANCGQPTHVADAGFVRRCPSCGASHHPRTDPVVIMLVTDGDRVLLGRQASWPPGRYSALAGFVEPGESLEEAVAREVREETGVRVSDARYVSSQPWPFPASLMLGFTARYAGGEASPSDSELEDVRWVARDALAAAIAGHGPIGVPPRLAIARRLMEGWLGRPNQ